MNHTNSVLCNVVPSSNWTDIKIAYNEQWLELLGAFTFLKGMFPLNGYFNWTATNERLVNNETKMLCVVSVEQEKCESVQGLFRK